MAEQQDGRMPRMETRGVTYAASACGLEGTGDGKYIMFVHRPFGTTGCFPVLVGPPWVQPTTRRKRSY